MSKKKNILPINTFEKQRQIGKCDGYFLGFKTCKERVLNILSSNYKSTNLMSSDDIDRYNKIVDLINKL